MMVYRYVVLFYLMIVDIITWIPGCGYQTARPCEDELRNNEKTQIFRPTLIGGSPATGWSCIKRMSSLT